MSGHLEQVRIFLAVAEDGGFARAARSLGTSASSVTRAVAELEDRLGVQLLTRTTRRVALTQAGAIYRDQMTPLVDQISQADDAVRAYQTDLQGRLRISAPLSFGLHFLADPLAQFRQENPGIELAVHLTDRFVDIMAGDFDMALRISGAPDDLSSIWRKIAPVNRTLVAAPGYLADHGHPATAQDLMRHKTLSYTHLTEGEVWQLRDPATQDTTPIRPPFSFASNNGDLLAAMAAHGEGIALLPDFLTAGARADGRLQPVLPGWTAPEIWLTAYYPAYQRLPAVIAKFTTKIEDCVIHFPL